MSASVFTNEEDRIRSLKSYCILDSLPEESYDDITFLALENAQVSRALVSFVDENRIWFKSSIGVNLKEIPRDISFCQYTIQQKDIMIVPDTLNDPCFKDSILVKQENIRFYAAMPIVDDQGNSLGTISVLDDKPRYLTSKQIKTLEILSKQVMYLLETRKNKMELEKILNHSITEADKYKSLSELFEEKVKERTDDLLQSNIKIEKLNQDLSESKHKYKNLSESLEIEVKNRTKELEFEKQKLIALLTNAPVAICLFNGPEHIYEFANHDYLETVGNRQLIGKSVREALPEIAGQGFYEMLDKVYSTGEPFIGKEIYSTIDKKNNGQVEDIYWNFIYQPIYNQNNEIIGISDFAFDITDQVIARQMVEKLNKELSVSEAKYRNLSEELELKVRERTQDLLKANKEVEYQRNKLNELFIKAPTLICLLEGPQHIFTFTNPLYEKMFGSNLIGKTIAEALPIFSNQGHFDILDKVYQTGEAFVGKEYPAFFDKAGDGNIVQCYFNFVYQPIFNSENQVEGISAFVFDVTDIILARQQLEKLNANLELSNQELQSFAYVASHDLQEPLRMITSYSQLLSRRYKNKLGEDAVEFIDNILDGGKRMKILIEDILNYSKISKKEMVTSVVDLNAVIESVTFNLQLSIEESNAILNYGNLPKIKVERIHMLQLFQNIIGNAIKYRKKDTQLIIDISVKQLDNSWLFSISDNGIGINPENFHQIFVIFRRLHGRSEYAGTGIGLASCKKIVELYGGSIWVESEEDKGSTFFFTLPL